MNGGVDQDPLDLCSDSEDEMRSNEKNQTIDTDNHRVMSNSNDIIDIQDSSDDDVVKAMRNKPAELLAYDQDMLQQGHDHNHTTRLPSAKELDDMIDSSDDEIAGLSPAQVNRIATAKWYASKNSKGFAAQKLSGADSCKSAGLVGKEILKEVKHEQKAAARTWGDMKSAVRGDDKFPDSGSSSKTALSLPIQSQSLISNTTNGELAKPTGVEQSKQTSATIFTQEFSLGTVGASPDSVVLDSLPKGSSISELKDKKNSLEICDGGSEYNNVKTLPSHPSVNKRTLPEQVLHVDSDRNDSGVLNTLPPLNSPSKTTAQMHIEHLRMMETQQLQALVRVQQRTTSNALSIEAKSNPWSRAQLNHHAESHPSEVVRKKKNISEIPHVTISNDDSAISTPASAINKVGTKPTNDEMAEYALSDILGQLECENLAVMGIRTFQHLENRKREFMHQYNNFITGVLRRKTMIDLSHDTDSSEEFECMDTTNNFFISPLQKKSQAIAQESKCKHADAVKSNRKKVARLQCKPADYPFKAQIHASPAIVVSGAIFPDSCHEDSSVKQIVSNQDTSVVISSAPESSSAKVASTNLIESKNREVKAATKQACPIPNISAPPETIFVDSGTIPTPARTDEMLTDFDDPDEEGVHEKRLDDIKSSKSPSTVENHDGDFSVASTSKFDEDQGLQALYDAALEVSQLFVDKRFRSKRPRATISYKEPDEMIPSADALIPYSFPSAKTKSTLAESKSSKGNIAAAVKRRPNRRPSQKKLQAQFFESKLEKQGELLGYSDRSVMDSIPHLSFKTYDKGTNFPRQRICVLGCTDETIYEFEIFIKESGIPNSGLGAFLKFLGARNLKSDCAERSNKLLLARHSILNPTKETLMAVRPEGFGVSVKLTGKNLHGNNNSDYWAEEALPMKVKLPNTSKIAKLVLTGKKLHYDSDEEEAPDVRQQKNPWQVARVGFLGIHVEGDYFYDDSVSFASSFPGCGYIDLGRYGPNLKGDRKPKALYELKSFLFGGEPAGWGFQVEEPLLGREQLIDITDDATGDISDAAKQMSAIYVNEVGHNPKLVQNVHAREKDGRVVEYYADITTPLRKGDTVELLTTYYSNYEENRERKGYGLINFSEGVKGDSHEPSRLQRNFDDRYEVGEMVKLYSVLDVFQACEFIVTSILPHFSDLSKISLQEFLIRQSSQAESLFTPRQMIARQRIHWISILLENRISDLMLSAQSSLPPSSIKSMLGQAEKWCLDMKWIQQVTDCDLSFENADSLLKPIEQEVVEEFLFPLRGKLPRALNETSWCQLAVELTKKLCVVTWKASTSNQTSMSLAKEYIDCAAKGAAAIREACSVPQGVIPATNIGFYFGEEGYHQISGDELWKSAAALSEPESTMSKGIMAQAADLCAYFDLVELGLVPEPIDRKNITVKIEGRVFVAKLPYSQNNHPCSTIGLPRSEDCFRRGVATLDKDWYIIWQVVYVAHTFASHYLLDPLVLDTFLVSLCTGVGIDWGKAKYAIDSGIKENVYSPNIVYCDPGQLSHSTPKSLRKERRRSSTDGTKKSRAPNSSPGVFHKNLNKFLFDNVIWITLSSLGWSIERGNRPNDLYFLPPGVHRSRPFQNRVDFFDSKKQILDCCCAHPNWKDRIEVKDALALYNAMLSLLEHLKATQKLPKGELNIEWLKQQLEEGGPQIQG